MTVYSPYAWPPTPILDPDAAATALGEALDGAWANLEAERLRLVRGVDSAPRRDLVTRRFREFQGAVDGFRAEASDHVERFLSLHVGPVYEQGARTVAPALPMTWTQAHTLALTSLSVDTFEDFLSRSQAAGRTAESFARQVRQASKETIAQVAAGGTTAKQGGDRLARKLLDDYRIDHVVYRDGSRVGVKSWARMAARTKSAVAYNAGTLNEAHQNGVKFVEVFDGSDCGWESHEDTDKADGSIRPVVEAAGSPVSHPNCLRAFGPRPDVTSAQDATKLQTRDLTDDALQSEVSALMAVNDYGPKFENLARELDRRDSLTSNVAQVAARTPGPVATDQAALNRLLYGDDFVEYGDEIVKRATNGKRLTPSQAAEKEIRAEYDSWVYTQWLRAEEDTRGRLLNRAAESQGIDASRLFTVDLQSLPKYASPELQEWFSLPGNRRMSFPEFRAAARQDRAASKAQQRLASRGYESEYG